MSQKYMSSRSFASLNILRAIKSSELDWMPCQGCALLAWFGGVHSGFQGYSWGEEKIPSTSVPLFVSVA